MNQTSDMLNILLQGSPFLLQTVVLLAGIVFCFFKMKDDPKPAGWLCMGLTGILMERLVGQIGTLILANSLPADAFVFYRVILSCILGIFGTAGLLLMIYAVFVSRPTRTARSAAAAHRTPVMSGNQSNPYSAPRAD